MTARETNLVNAFETTLAAQLASGGTSMNLTDDPGVDAPAYFVIDPDNDSNREVILWASGTNHAAATVTRDIDSKHGTDPTHASGTKVRLAVVKQHIEEAHDAIQQGFILEDDDGTEVEIKPAVASGVYTQREVKFIDGNGIDINWTDTDNGTDGDPYDLTFKVDIANSTELASGLALTDELLVSDAGDIKRMDISLIADAIDGAGIDASAGTLVNAAIGKQSIWVPAPAMNPTATNGCAAIAALDSGGNTGPDLYTLDFAGATANEHAQFSVAFPSYWNESTVTFKVYWTSEATDTDGVVWELKGVGLADSDSLNTAFGTGIHVDDANIGTAKDLHITAESSAVTIAGSPAAGELCYFNVSRLQDDGSDTAAEDAKLIGIKLFYTVDDVHEA